MVGFETPKCYDGTKKYDILAHCFASITRMQYACFPDVLKDGVSLLWLGFWGLVGAEYDRACHHGGHYWDSYFGTVKPVCNDHLYKKFITCDLFRNVF